MIVQLGHNRAERLLLFKCKIAYELGASTALDLDNCFPLHQATNLPEKESVAAGCKYSILDQRCLGFSSASLYTLSITELTTANISVYRIPQKQ